MARSPNQRLKVLQKRADFLARRIDEAECKGMELSHDKTEYAALTWAITFIKLAIGYINVQKEIEQNKGEEK